MHIILRGTVNAPNRNLYRSGCSEPPVPGGRHTACCCTLRSSMGHVPATTAWCLPDRGSGSLSCSLSASRITLPNLGCSPCASRPVPVVVRRRPETSAGEKDSGKRLGNEKFWLAPSKSEMGSDNGSKAIEPEVGIIKAVLSTMAAVSQRNRSNHAAVSRVTTHVNPLGSAA